MIHVRRLAVLPDRLVSAPVCRRLCNSRRSAPASGSASAVARLPLRKATIDGFPFLSPASIAPGLSVNLSRSGPSLSVGVRGAHVTVGRKGVTKTIRPAPGTGIFWTSRIGQYTGYHSAASYSPQTPEQRVVSDRHVERAIVVVVLIVLAAFFGWSLAQ